MHATKDHELVSLILVDENHRKINDHKTISIKPNPNNETNLEHSSKIVSNLEALEFLQNSIDFLGLKSDVGNLKLKFFSFI